MIKGINNKRGQVTIFIILAIIVVAAIVGYYLLRSEPASEINPQENPQAFIEKCLMDEIKKSTDEILPQGGIINPQPFLLFSETKVQFLCYIEGKEQQCEILEPMLKDKIERQIEQDTQSKINNCLNRLEDIFENYDYVAGPTKYLIEIFPGEISGTIDKKITITKDGATQEFSTFVSRQYSPVFDFILISNQIIRKEATCICGEEHCGADIVAISRLNSDYELELFVSGKDEKIYTIRDTKTKQEFNFAVRNCILAL
jgi:hypothetical protein